MRKKKHITKKHSFYELYQDEMKPIFLIAKILGIITAVVCGIFLIINLLLIIEDYWATVPDSFYRQLFTNTLTICMCLLLLIVSGIMLLYISHYYLYFRNIKYLPLTKEECLKLNIDNVDKYLLTVNKMIMPFYLTIYYHCHDEIEEEIIDFVKDNFDKTKIYFSCECGFKKAGRN